MKDQLVRSGNDAGVMMAQGQATSGASNSGWKDPYLVLLVESMLDHTEALRKGSLLLEACTPPFA